jgi:8-oxo-dGTP diphosphatase
MKSTTASSQPPTRDRLNSLTPRYEVEQWLNVVLEEYKAVRAEILVSLQLQQQVIAFGITVLGAASAVGLNFLQSNVYVSAGIGLISPAIALVVVLVWVGELERMVRAGAWVALTERRLATSFAPLPPPLGWESALRGVGNPFPVVRVLYRYRGILGILPLLSNAPNTATVWANWARFDAWARAGLLSVQAGVTLATILVYFLRERRASAIGRASRDEVLGIYEASASPLTSAVARAPVLCVAAAVTRQDGAVLCVKRQNEPAAGRWTLPGGRVQYGETLVAAAIRELVEETAAVTTSCRFRGVYDHIEPGHHLEIAVFECTWVGGEVKAADDAIAVAWFERTELEKLNRTEGLFDYVFRTLGARESTPGPTYR